MKLYGRLFIVTLALGVLAFGGVYPWIYWPLAVLAFALGLWAIIVTRVWLDWRVRRLAVVLAAVGAAIGLQLVPLPYGVFDMVSPEGDGILGRYALAWASQRPAWHAVSLFPSATLTALALYIALATLLVGLVRAVRYMPLDWMVTQVMGLGILLALIGLVQLIVWSDGGERLIYFFWRPVYAEGATPFGPFVNRNHFAGWMVMALPLVLGYAWAILDAARRPVAWSPGAIFRWLAEPQVGRFALVTAGGATMAASVVLTGSRSGAGSLVVALAVLGAFFVARVGRRAARLAVGAGVVLLFGAAAAWVGLDLLTERLQVIPADIQDRIAVWRDTVRMFGDFPIAGTGFGAYGMVMLFYQSAPQHTAFVQAHNDYLQVLAEGGLLVSIPAAVAVGWILVGIRRRFAVGDDVPATHWVRAGAFAGLVGIATQSLVEFSLQKPANALLFVLLLAIALHRPRQVVDDANRV
jgi:hypothetical protein